MGWSIASVSDDDKLDAQQARQVLRRTARSLGPYRRGAMGALVLLVTWTATTLAGPMLVRRAVDKGLRADDSTALNTSIALYVVVVIVAYFAYRTAILTLAKVGEGFLRDLRNRVFGQLLRQSMSFYDREKAGVIVSRMTSDVDSLQELVQLGLLMFTSATLLLVGTVVVLTLLSWQLTLICLAAVPFVAVASLKFQRDSNRAYLQVRDRIGATLSSLQEGISGVRVVQAYGREDVEANRFADTNRRLFRSHMKSVKVAAWYLPVIDFAGVATTALAVGVGGWMATNGDLSLGTVIAFILILQGLFEPVQQLSQLFNMVQSATASLSKVYELLDQPSDVAEVESPVAIPDSGPLTLTDVGFAYQGGDPVLHGVNLTIAAGERVAFVGPTGAGKSTLAKLVARLYDPTIGHITADGVDMREATLASLRERVVMVPQEGFLFAGTIADNIRIAVPDATDEQVDQALESIGVGDVFRSLPDGLATAVNERGSRLSAGEKQLVSLARAALVDPGVLILDEATSSLDPGTESSVEAAMDSLMAGRTVIVIAHRLTTAARCDRIAVIDAGGITELGSHDDLLVLGGSYASLYEAWTTA